MSENLEDIKISIKYYLTGYGKKNRAALKHFLTYKNWQIDVNREMERRRSRLLDIFSVQELAAVANGELDMALLAAEFEQALGAEE